MRKLIALGVAAGAVSIGHGAWAQDVAAALPQDLSPWGMVSHADWVVKAVLAGLAFASVATWTVALAKAAELLATGRRNAGGLAALQGAASLAAATPRGFCGTLVEAARAELQASAPSDHRPLDGPARDGVKERTALKLERLVAGSSRALNRGTGILATISATAPFVGLFGTVWGIMNSFIGISRAQTTNLAVVAPGIAEALLATAIGLVAAIPAVVIYNLVARVISAQRARLQDAAAETLRLLSRDLDLARPAPAERTRPVAAE